jgi:hypothetical protein
MYITKVGKAIAITAKAMEEPFTRAKIGLNSCSL